MNIHLDQLEMEIIRRKAEEFRKETGANYSMKYIGLLLKEQYTKRFLQDIDTVMETKRREEEEAAARESGNF